MYENFKSVAENFQKFAYFDFFVVGSLLKK